LRIITANLNGIRAAAKKGFFAWVQKQDADFVCLQEIKAQEPILQDPSFALQGYQSFFYCAEKKGYSGVGIYSRHPVKKVIRGLGFEVADQEGRYLALDMGKFTVASLYLPSGTSGEHRQAIKYDFLERYAKQLRDIQNQSQPYIICGDWNIAHQKIDLKNWRTNQKTSGFLPEERAWMDQLLNELNFVDAFRIVNQEPEQYTWWSQRSREAFANNVGWRIDYQIITPNLKSLVQSASIYREERFSDHAPLIMDYAI
jgi:exodeoxyribonuclease III